MGTNGKINEIEHDRLKALIFNDAIFAVRDYIEQNNGEPLTVTQYKTIRQHVLESYYDEMLDKLENQTDENVSFDELRYNMSDMVIDGLFDHDGQEGVLETYLRTIDAIPKKTENSLYEYACKGDNRLSADYYAAIDDVMAKEQNYPVDIFNKVKLEDDIEVDVSGIGSINAFLFGNKNKQKNMIFGYENTTPENDMYEPQYLSRELMLVGKKDMYYMPQIYRQEYESDSANKMHLYTKHGDTVTEYELGQLKENGIQTVKKFESMGISGLRKYFKNGEYDEFLKDINTEYAGTYKNSNNGSSQNYKYNKIDEKLNKQAIKNAVAICEDLERRGLDFQISKTSYGKGTYEAVVDIGKEPFNIRVFDMFEPNYVGRIYDGVSSVYFSMNKAVAGKHEEMYMPNENEVKDLIACALGESVVLPDTDINGNQVMLGTNGDVVNKNGNRVIQSKKNRKSNTVEKQAFNRNYWSENMTSMHYRMHTDADSVVIRIDSNENNYYTNNIKNDEYAGMSDSERKKSIEDYLDSKIEDATGIYFNSVLGEDFFYTNDVDDVFFPYTSDKEIKACQEQYRKFLKYDYEVLREADETEEEYNERKEKLRENDDFPVLTFEEKKRKIIEHNRQLAQQIIGKSGGKGTSSNPIVINVAKVCEYTGDTEKEILTKLKNHSPRVTVDFMANEEFSRNSIREKMIKFDNVAKKSLLDRSRGPFWDHMRDTITESLQAQGLNLSSLDVDKNGIIRYKGTCIDKQGYAIDSQPETFDITGYIGQIFEPNNDGIILTNYNHDDNKAIIPKYVATVKRQNIGENKSLEQRLICRGYEQLMDAKIRRTIHKQFVTRDFSNVYNETILNSVYRQMHADKLPYDYMAEYEKGNMAPHIVDAKIDLEKSVVRLPSRLKETSTINVFHKLNKERIIDDDCNDDYAKTGENVSILKNCVGLDSYFTGNAYNQGIIRYLVVGASVDENGSIVPPKNEDGSIIEDNRASIFYVEPLKLTGYDPFDRGLMSGGNLKDGFGVIELNTAFTTISGLGTEDGNIISKEAAERMFIPAKNPVKMLEMDTAHIKNYICNENGELNLEYDSKGNPYIKFVGKKFYSDVVDERFISPDNNKSKSDIYAEYIKEELINDKTYIRSHMIGDKLCDGHGNKGTTSFVIDRNMPDERAEELGLLDAVRFFRANPELDIVCQPYSSPSRLNAGTFREMNESAKPLNLIDGTVIPGGMGRLNFTITDKFVDEKTHIYSDGYDDEEMELSDDDIADEVMDIKHDTGKGRNISSQLAWLLQAKELNRFMDYIYGNNEDSFTKVRERLISLGYDLDQNMSPVIGYEPRTAVINGKVVSEQRAILNVESDGSLAISPDGTSERIDRDKVKEYVKSVHNELSNHSGFIRIPFPIELKSGKMTQPATDEIGGYLLPVVPPYMRAEESYDDGRKITHNYTNRYLSIIENSMYYYAYKEQAKEYERVINAMKKNEPVSSEKISLYKKSNNGQVPRTLDEIIRRYSSVNDKISEVQLKAQNTYDLFADDMEKTYFTGKKNVFKTEIMTKPFPNSATAVLTPAPMINLDECMMSPQMAKMLGLKEGEPLILWRDPTLRTEGIALFNVKIAPPEIELNGVALNPANTKRFDADHDGDTVGIVSLSNIDLVQDVKEYDKNINYLLKKIDKANTKGEDISKLEKQLSSAKLDYDEAYEKLSEHTKMVDELRDKISVKNTLVDNALTPDNPETIDDVTLNLNMGLDMASAIGKIKENNETILVPDGNGNMVDVLNLEDMAKQDILDGNNNAAIEKLNTYVKTLYKHSTEADYIDFYSCESFYESQNRIIIDHKAKGKIKAMIEFAKFSNHEIGFLRDGDTEQHVYTGDEMMEYLKKDKDAIFRIDTREGAVIDYGEPILSMKIDSPNLTEEQKQFIIQRKNEMKDTMSQIMYATAIKTLGTGVAGACSQRGIKITRDVAALNTLEITYGATQGILQAKHDAKQAKQLYTILKDTLPALLNGKGIKYDEKQGWIPDPDKEYLTKEEFIEQYHNLCVSDTGLNFKLHKQRIQNLADILYTKNERGEDIFISMYSKEYSSNLDNCAYSNKSLDDFHKIAQQNSSGPENGRQSLFNTPKTAEFIPGMDKLDKKTDYEKKEEIFYVLYTDEDDKTAEWCKIKGKHIEHDGYDMALCNEKGVYSLIDIKTGRECASGKTIQNCMADYDNLISQWGSAELFHEKLTEIAQQGGTIYGDDYVYSPKFVFDSKKLEDNAKLNIEYQGQVLNFYENQENKCWVKKQGNLIKVNDENYFMVKEKIRKSDDSKLYLYHGDSGTKVIEENIKDIEPDEKAFAKCVERLTENNNALYNTLQEKAQCSNSFMKTVKMEHPNVIAEKLGKVPFTVKMGKDTEDYYILSDDVDTGWKKVSGKSVNINGVDMFVQKQNDSTVLRFAGNGQIISKKSDEKECVQILENMVNKYGSYKVAQNIMLLSSDKILAYGNNPKYDNIVSNNISKDTELPETNNKTRKKILTPDVYNKEMAELKKQHENMVNESTEKNTVENPKPGVVKSFENNRKVEKSFQNDKIIMLGPNANDMYGNEANSETKAKYNKLYTDIKSDIVKRYNDGYRVFVTLENTGYNNLVSTALTNLKKTYPDIKNCLITSDEPTPENKTHDNSVLFDRDDCISKMRECADQKKAFSKDGITNMLKHSLYDVSILNVTDDNSWKERDNSTIAQYLRIVDQAKKQNMMPDISVNDMIAYKKNQHRKEQEKGDYSLSEVAMNKTHESEYSMEK